MIALLIERLAAIGAFSLARAYSRANTLLTECVLTVADHRVLDDSIGETEK